MVLAATSGVAALGSHPADHREKNPDIRRYVEHVAEMKVVLRHAINYQRWTLYRHNSHNMLLRLTSQQGTGHLRSISLFQSKICRYGDCTAFTAADREEELNGVLVPAAPAIDADDRLQNHDALYSSPPRDFRIRRCHISIFRGDGKTSAATRDCASINSVGTKAWLSNQDKTFEEIVERIVAVFRRHHASDCRGAVYIGESPASTRAEPGRSDTF